MELGMIGLGRMGANMVERLIKAGHQCVVNDTNSDTVRQLMAKGAKGTTKLPEFIQMLSKRRAVWKYMPENAAGSLIGFQPNTRSPNVSAQNAT